MRPWAVYVQRGGRAVYLGEVHADNEEWARCAALSRYGVTEEEVHAGELEGAASAILPDDDFEVRPA